MLTFRVNECLATVVCYLVKQTKRKGDQRYEFGDAYRRIVKSYTKHIVGIVTELVKHWSLDEVTAEKKGISTEKDGDSNGDLKDGDQRTGTTVCEVNFHGNS